MPLTKGRYETQLLKVSKTLAYPKRIQPLKCHFLSINKEIPKNRPGYWVCQHPMRLIFYHGESFQHGIVISLRFGPPVRF